MGLENIFIPIMVVVLPALIVYSQIRTQTGLLGGGDHRDSDRGIIRSFTRVDGYTGYISSRIYNIREREGKR